MEVTLEKNGMITTASSLGGTVTNFSVDEHDIIYPQIQIGNKLRGGIPLCFPWFSNPPENFAGMRKHGWLRDQILSLNSCGEDFVHFYGIIPDMELSPNPWWLISFDVIVRLLETGLKIEFKAKRLEIPHAPSESKGPVPINFAFHPFFDSLAGTHYAVIGERRIEEFPKDSVQIPFQNNFFISHGSLRTTDVKVHGFDQRSCQSLWSDKPQSYFCIEPVLTHPDLYGTPNGSYLGENESFCASLLIEAR